MNDRDNIVKAVLFDLDGVVFDTEPLYTEFWNSIFEKYYTGEKGLTHKIKGQTLIQIYDQYFAGKDELQKEITSGLNVLEQNMELKYIDGFMNFLNDIKSHDVKTAIVTSSNQPKMDNVYRQHEGFKSLFDGVFTSEDFLKSKPDPYCYLHAASVLSVDVDHCVVFEDSINGLKAGMAANMFVYGLTTTNSIDEIVGLCNVSAKDYNGLTYEKMYENVIKYR